MKRTASKATKTANIRRRRPKEAKTAPAEEQYLSRSVTRAFDVLECFPNAMTALSLKDLTRRVGMPESSLFRLLVTLGARGYLQQRDDGTYALTPRTLHGKLWERGEKLRLMLHPFLVRLARRFNETTSLAFLYDDRIAVLDGIESQHDIRAINKVGRLLPPYASSMGKAITALQERDLQERLLTAYGVFPRTSRTVTDHNAIHADFEQIRALGYACDRGEATEGGVCLGAPVFTGENIVEAAISISVPLIRISEEREREIIAELLQVTREMSALVQREAVQKTVS